MTMSNNSMLNEFLKSNYIATPICLIKPHHQPHSSFANYLKPQQLISNLHILSQLCEHMSQPPIVNTCYPDAGFIRTTADHNS